MKTHVTTHRIPSQHSPYLVLSPPSILSNNRPDIEYSLIDKNIHEVSFTPW